MLTINDVRVGQLVRVKDFRLDPGICGRGALTNSVRHAMIGKEMYISGTVHSVWQELPIDWYVYLSDVPNHGAKSTLVWPPRWLEVLRPLAELVKRYQKLEHAGN